MSSGKKYFKVFLVIITIGLIVIASIYAGNRRNEAVSELKNIVTAESQGCDTDVKAVISRLSSREGEERSKLYAPVYSFEYEGKRYDVTGTIWKTDPDYKSGQEVQIKIDPSDPTHIYDPASNSETELTSFFLEAGLMFMIPGLVFGLIIVVIVIFVVVQLKKNAGSKEP